MTTRPEDMVLFTTCANETEAELIAFTLREQGVAATAVGVISATALGPVAGGSDVARVVVQRNQLDEATRLLQRSDVADHTGSQQDESRDDGDAPQRRQNRRLVKYAAPFLAFGLVVGYMLYRAEQDHTAREHARYDAQVGGKIHTTFSPGTGFQSITTDSPVAQTFLIVVTTSFAAVIVMLCIAAVRRFNRAP